MSRYLITWHGYQDTEFSGDLFAACDAAQQWYERCGTDADDDPDHQPVTYSWQLEWTDRRRRDAFRLHADGFLTAVSVSEVVTCSTSLPLRDQT